MFKAHSAQYFFFKIPKEFKLKKKEPKKTEAVFDRLEIQLRILITQ